MNISVERLRTAANSVAHRLEAKAAAAQAEHDEMVAFAAKNKQALPAGYWESAHLARVRAQAARKVAEAIGEVGDA